jgi:hypothetical protein
MSNRIPKSKLDAFDVRKEVSLRKLAESAFDQVSLDALTDVVSVNPDNGDILRYNAGLMAWENVPLPTSGGNPGGVDQQLQFNDNGVFGGISGSGWDGVTLNLPSSMLTQNTLVLQTEASGGDVFAGVGAGDSQANMFHSEFDGVTTQTHSIVISQTGPRYQIDAGGPPLGRIIAHEGNVKTVGGESIFGSGDIAVTGSSPAGTTGDIQYRSSTGTFAATAGFNYDTGTNTLTVNNIQSNQYFNTGTATTIFGTGNANPVQMVTEFSGTVGVLDLIANDSAGTAVAELRLRSNQAAPLFWDGTTQSTVLHSGNVKTVGGESILGTGDIPVTGGPVAAEDVTYDNTTSGLAATDVQAAIDELAGQSVVIPDAQIVSALGNSFALKIDPQLYSPSGNYFDVAGESALTASAHSRAFRGASGGKWYFEVAVSGTVGGGTTSIGVVRTQTTAASSQVGSSGSGLGTSWGLLGDGRRFSGSAPAYGSAYGNGDVVMVACDMTPAAGSRKIWWGLNGTWFASGDPAAGTNEAFANLTQLVAPGVTPGTGTCTLTLRLRSSEFSYSPPSGFSPWVT